MKPKTYEFEGRRMTLAEIARMAKIHRRTAYDRLLKGEKTVAELQKPGRRFVNPAWNNAKFGKGHTA